MWENNLGVSDVEGYKRKKGVGRYWKYIKLCAALLLYLAAVRSNAHVQARAGYAAAFLNDRAVTAKEAEQICEAEAEQEYPAAICFFKEQPDTSLFCRETGEASVVNQIRIIGNAELLMYGSNALSFRKNGCYLDTATVCVLFGTDKVAGQTVRSGDQSCRYLEYLTACKKKCSVWQRRRCSWTGSCFCHPTTEGEGMSLSSFCCETVLAGMSLILQW